VIDKIYELANKGFNLYAGENSKVNGGFEHSGLFALIKKRRYSLQERWFWKSYSLLWWLDKKGVRDIQQDINVLLEE
jgi:protein SCO1/2